jgi:hypothetical protein
LEGYKFGSQALNVPLKCLCTFKGGVKRPFVLSNEVLMSPVFLPCLGKLNAPSGDDYLSSFQLVLELENPTLQLDFWIGIGTLILFKVHLSSG